MRSSSVSITSVSITAPEAKAGMLMLKRNSTEMSNVSIRCFLFFLLYDYDDYGGGHYEQGNSRKSLPFSRIIITQGKGTEREIIGIPTPLYEYYIQTVVECQCILMTQTENYDSIQKTSTGFGGGTQGCGGQKSPAAFRAAGLIFPYGISIHRTQQQTATV